MRALLYLLARLLGDIAAVSSGRTGRRVSRRIAGKTTGKMLGDLFR